MTDRAILNHAEAVFAKAKEAATTMQASEVEARDAKIARLKSERLARDANDEAPR